MTSMNSVELFVGAGGLGLGVSRAGFRALRLVEIDQHACDTIRENAKRKVKHVQTWPLRQADVRTIKYESIKPRIHLVTGGPSCQPFSVGGRHKAEADARDMFPEAIRAVRELQPKAFIFENVKGLKRQSFATYFKYLELQMSYPEIVAKNDEDWEEHLARLEKHHTKGEDSVGTYRVVSRVLNAADYGVPQKRERVFFVGFRADLGIEWSFPSGTHSKQALHSQMVSEEYWERHKVAKKDRIELGSSSSKKSETDSRKLPWRTVRDALSDLPDPEIEVEESKAWHNHGFQPGARSYPGHTGSYIDEPAKTLKAGVHGVPGGENMLRREDGSVRYFSVRESARIQTFPDDFIFHGAWSECMRQLGNAVPVELAHLIASDVHKHLRSAP